MFSFWHIIGNKNVDLISKLIPPPKIFFSNIIYNYLRIYSTEFSFLKNAIKYKFLPCFLGRYKLQLSHKADLHKHEKYGDTVREKFGSLNVVNSFLPETMEIFFRHEGQYPFRGEFSTLKAYRESRKQWYKTTGIMVL